MQTNSLYSLKKNDNPLLKLLAEKKDKEKNKNMLDLQRKIIAYNLKKKSDMINLKKDKEDNEDDIIIKKVSNTKLNLSLGYNNFYLVHTQLKIAFIA